MEKELQLIKKFGNRTNSFMTLYPGLQSYHTEDGVIRYLENEKSCLVASEPLMDDAVKPAHLVKFAQAAREKRKRSLIFPISKSLANQLSNEGMHIWQIGSEPIFDLNEYFFSELDPLMLFPVAKSLQKRGGEVHEILFDELSSPVANHLKNEISHIAEAWLKNKKSSSLGFLSQVNPFYMHEQKRFFALRVRGQIQAFISAVPIYLDQGEIKGYYFADFIRAPWARAGSNELLFVETLKILKEEGVLEVRLGMAPLALIENKDFSSKILQSLFDHWSFRYNFKSLYQFKEKLAPTRWEPLYVASTRASFVFMLKDCFQAHLSSESKSNSFFQLFINLWKNSISFQNEKLNSLWPKTGTEFFQRTKLTSTFVLFFTLLHFARLKFISVDQIFNSAAFIPGQISSLGIWVGPLFHNHFFHLIGDQLSFYFFGAMIEMFFGPAIFLFITAAGLWLSNPITHLLVGQLLQNLNPIYFSNFLIEKDYGSSNAVFALIGAVCFSVKQRKWIHWPFILFSFYICFQRESFLAIHHFVGMGLGFIIALSLSASRANKLVSK